MLCMCGSVGGNEGWLTRCSWGLMASSEGLMCFESSGGNGSDANAGVSR